VKGVGVFARKLSALALRVRVRRIASFVVERCRATDFLRKPPFRAAFVVFGWPVTTRPISGTLWTPVTGVTTVPNRSPSLDDVSKEAMPPLFSASFVHIALTFCPFLTTEIIGVGQIFRSGSDKDRGAG